MPLQINAFTEQWCSVIGLVDRFTKWRANVVLYCHPFFYFSKTVGKASRPSLKLAGLLICSMASIMSAFGIDG